MARLPSHDLLLDGWVPFKEAMCDVHAHFDTHVYEHTGHCGSLVFFDLRNVFRAFWKQDTFFTLFESDKGTGLAVLLVFPFLERSFLPSSFSWLFFLSSSWSFRSFLYNITPFCNELKNIYISYLVVITPHNKTLWYHEFVFISW